MRIAQARSDSVRPGRSIIPEQWHAREGAGLARSSGQGRQGRPASRAPVARRREGRPERARPAKARSGSLGWRGSSRRCARRAESREPARPASTPEGFHTKIPRRRDRRFQLNRRQLPPSGMDPTVTFSALQRCVGRGAHCAYIRTFKFNRLSSPFRLPALRKRFLKKARGVPWGS